MREKYNQRIIYPVLFILIPCIVGMIGMVSKNVPVAIWIQNLVMRLLLSFVAMFVLKFNLKFNYKIIVIVSAFLLGLTFLEPNMDGVHPWLRFPFFTLNIATIVIPITIVAFYRLVEEKQFVISAIGIIVIAFLLSLQPVNYTEGILTMLHDLSVVLYVIGIATLLWIPLYFLISCRNKNRYRNYNILLVDDFIDMDRKFSCAFYGVWNFAYIGFLYSSYLVYEWGKNCISSTSRVL